MLRTCSKSLFSHLIPFLLIATTGLNSRGESTGAYCRRSQVVLRGKFITSQKFRSSSAECQRPSHICAISNTTCEWFETFLSCRRRTTCVSRSVWQSAKKLRACTRITSRSAAALQGAAVLAPECEFILERALSSSTRCGEFIYLPQGIRGPTGWKRLFVPEI